jgi:hypothetical protein
VAGVEVSSTNQHEVPQALVADRAAPRAHRDTLYDEFCIFPRAPLTLREPYSRGFMSLDSNPATNGELDHGKPRIAEPRES